MIAPPPEAVLPTSLGLGIGGAGRAAIALVVVGGQSLCLFLTLLLIPVVYVQFAGLEDTIVNRRWKRFISQFRPSRWIRPATVDRQATQVRLVRLVRQDARGATGPAGPGPTPQAPTLRRRNRR